MDKILILGVVVGILGYSWQQSKKYLSPTSSFNAIITFDPEHYTDIRWFEVFRKLTHWEKFGAYSFKGTVATNAEDIVHLIHKELEVPLENFKVKVFPIEKTSFDYIVTFKKIPRPEIEDYPQLAELAIWNKYGKNSYRLWLGMSVEQFREVISQELHIPEDSFTVYCPGNLVWTRFL